MIGAGPPFGGFLARHRGFVDSVSIATAFLTSTLRTVLEQVNHEYAPEYGILSFDHARHRVRAEPVYPGADHAG